MNLCRKKKRKPRNRPRTKPCPRECPCICHDTGGVDAFHPGEVCPYKHDRTWTPGDIVVNPPPKKEE